jgi:hypothetical protein
MLIELFLDMVGECLSLVAEAILLGYVWLIVVEVEYFSFDEIGGIDVHAVDYNSK